MTTPLYFGNTPARRADGIMGLFRVWAHVEPDQTVSAITYGISDLIVCAHGPLRRSECVTQLQQELLAFADRTAKELEFDDGIVIEDWDE